MDDVDYVKQCLQDLLIIVIPPESCHPFSTVRRWYDTVLYHLKVFLPKQLKYKENVIEFNKSEHDLTRLCTDCRKTTVLVFNEDFPKEFSTWTKPEARPYNRPEARPCCRLIIINMFNTEGNRKEHIQFDKQIDYVFSLGCLLHLKSKDAFKQLEIEDHHRLVYPVFMPLCNSASRSKVFNEYNVKICTIWLAETDQNEDLQQILKLLHDVKNMLNREVHLEWTVFVAYESLKKQLVKFLKGVSIVVKIEILDGVEKLQEILMTNYIFIQTGVINGQNFSGLETLLWNCPTIFERSAHSDTGKMILDNLKLNDAQFYYRDGKKGEEGALGKFYDDSSRQFIDTFSNVMEADNKAKKVAGAYYQHSHVTAHLQSFYNVILHIEEDGLLKVGVIGDILKECGGFIAVPEVNIQSSLPRLNTLSENLPSRSINEGETTPKTPETQVSVPRVRHALSSDSDTRSDGAASSEIISPGQFQGHPLTNVGGNSVFKEDRKEVVPVPQAALPMNQSQVSLSNVDITVPSSSGGNGAKKENKVKRHKQRGLKSHFTREFENFMN